MKIRIRGTETFKVEKMFEPITLDSEQFPELQLEIEAVAEANFMGNTTEEERALESLYAKMHDTTPKGSFHNESQRGESVMSLLGPFETEQEVNYSAGGVVFKLMGVDNETTDG